MSYNENQEEEVEIISVREEQVKEIIKQFLNGEKALSFSSLKTFGDSPAAFLQYQLKERKTTDAMKFGTLLHCITLEPDSFDSRYAVYDDAEKCAEIGGAMPRATKVYKEWKSSFISKYPGREVISMDIFNKAAIMSNNIVTNRAAAPILDICTEREKHVEWKYKEMKFRGFIDAKTPAGSKKKAKIDLKTCKDANPKKFIRDIINNDYHVQAAMYDAADSEEGYVPYFIIASDAKGGVSVNQIDERLMEYGRKKYDLWVDAFNKCLITESFDQSYDFWSDNKSGIFTAELPAYLQ